jgi:hypothetical protein
MKAAIRKDLFKWIIEKNAMARNTTANDDIIVSVRRGMKEVSNLRQEMLKIAIKKNFLWI